MRAPPVVVDLLATTAELHSAISRARKGELIYVPSASPTCTARPNHMEFLSPDIHREIFGWRSPNLGMEMPIVRYGYWGKALLILPTAQADFLENERFFLIKSIEPLIRQGRITVFSIDSINRHAWMNRQLPVPEQARRQALYSSYIEEEVIPHIRRSLQDRHARMMITGASFGAFHAANLFFRRPDAFDTLIAMSGFYDLGNYYLKGYMDDNVYYNNPGSYVPNISDRGYLELMMQNRIHLLSGRGDYELPEASQRFSGTLWNKGIWNNLDLWGHDMKHDWPTWRAMLPHYLEHRVGI